MGGFPSPAQAPALIIDCPRPFPAAIGQIPQEIHQHTESVSRNFYQALQVFYNPKRTLSHSLIYYLYRFFNKNCSIIRYSNR